MKWFRKISIAISVAFAAFTGYAGILPGDDEVLRPVNSSYMVDIGSSHLADTYLSPLKYTGWNAAFQYERMQAMKFRPDSWRQQLLIVLEVNSAENPARNADIEKKMRYSEGI